MGDMMKAKRYYRIEFENASALTVGSGKNEGTDNDLVRDSRGVPYIPASAIAGVYRALFEEKEAAYYFGNVNGNGEAQDSRLIIYDAVIKNGEEYKVSIRDGVGLDDKKTAINGAKFDFEILEPGVTFVTYIEQNKYADDYNVGDVIAGAWINGRIVIGSKSSRGLGRTKVVGVQVREFSFENEAEIDDWLDFSLDSGSFEDFELSERVDSAAEKDLSVRLKLVQKGPISIRVYSTNIGEADYEQLSYVRKENDKETEIPVVPGTSWAGAFRHQMERLDSGCLADYFGINAKLKSRIRFSESEITQASSKMFTRNAIDRFTGGTIDTALFTEKYFYGGKTELVITLPINAKERFLKCLCAAIADLHMGILSIGGETSVGHGIFEIEKAFCGDKEIEFDSPEMLYRKLLDSLLKHKQEENA